MDVVSACGQIQMQLWIRCSDSENFPALVKGNPCPVRQSQNPRLRHDAWCWTIVALIQDVDVDFEAAYPPTAKFRRGAGRSDHLREKATPRHRTTAIRVGATEAESAYGPVQCSYLGSCGAKTSDHDMGAVCSCCTAFVCTCLLSSRLLPTSVDT
ncbi:hypothetical protein DENSPDRAFT_707348 [Dentipellis sp. KUC8613]|nr:hypothetical protein DENSPDRAFT_707348 [Dentipellis sp. KUC8613]